MGEPFYHKVGTAFRDSFIYQNSAGGVTGKTSGDFTVDLSKDGTGNQPTTGITITEVDATNNAGEYSIAVSTSGFVAATGTYALVIYETADPDQRWSITIKVNATGLADGSTGAALFSSSSGDGRVTDGSSPLAGADVFVKDPSGTTRYQITADANGDYDVYLDTDGTWTITGQESGYQQASVSVVVSGSTATGPGSDIELTALSSSSSVTYAELLAYARRQALDQTGSRTDAVLQDAINDALMQVATSGSWEWLESYGAVALNASYSTGTIAITNESATVTLTGGTFPSWAASGKVYIGGHFYRVSTRDSDTQLTLADTFIGVTNAAATYLLYRNEYTLPADMLRFGSFLQGRNYLSDAVPMSFAHVADLEDSYQYGSNYTSSYAIKNGTLVVFPYPTSDERLNFTYYRKPARMTSGADTMDFDPNHRALVHRAIDYQLTLHFGEIASGARVEQTQIALERELSRGITTNRSTSKPRRPLSDGSGPRRVDPHRNRHS